MSAARTDQAGEPCRGQTAREVGPQRALDEARQLRSALLPATAEEVFEVITNDLVEDTVLRPMPLVLLCRHGRRYSSLRATLRRRPYWPSQPLRRSDSDPPGLENGPWVSPTGEYAQYRKEVRALVPFVF